MAEAEKKRKDDHQEQKVDIASARAA